MPRLPSPSTPEPSAPAPVASSAPGGQPAWLSRVAARWEQEDAAAEAEDAAVAQPESRMDEPRPAGRTAAPWQGAPVSSSAEPAVSSSAEQEAQAQEEAPAAPAQPESSRADAWRRAWGLPPLDVEEDDR